jgi:hypothetical protein
LNRAARISNHNFVVIAPKVLNFDWVNTVSTIGTKKRILLGED